MNSHIDIIISAQSTSVASIITRAHYVCPYAFSLKDIIYCVCNIIDNPLILCKLAQVNKLFNNVVIDLSYYKSCKSIYIEDKNNKQSEHIITTIKYGNLRLLKFLSPVINKKNLNNIFIGGCDYGYLEIIKWLLEYDKLIGSPIDIHINDEYAFQLACYNGRLALAQWLIEYGRLINSPIDIHATKDLAIRWACKYGHLVLAQWLISYAILINSPIDIHLFGDINFRLSCQNGHLALAQWLIDYSKSINSPINIHADNEYAFRWACENGHLETIKWLMEYSKVIGSPIDIHVNNGWIFNNSPYCIIDWLKTL